MKEYRELVATAAEQSYQASKSRYDAAAGMVAVKGDGDTSKNYHSQLNCAVKHPLRNTAELALCVYEMEDTAFYGEAERMLMNLIRCQDTNPQSPTYGLWAYFAEERLEEMFNPDYNWANFIGKILVRIYLAYGAKLSRSLYERLPAVIGMAAECSVRRNAAPDYTNIAVMSALFILLAGEITGNPSHLAEGQRRIRLLYDYFKINGAPSEYNSSTYTPLAIGDISDLLGLIGDEAISAWVTEINRMLCECFVKHYHPGLNQLAPPQYRAYHDYSSYPGDCIFRMTKGRFGQHAGGFRELLCDLPDEAFRMDGERWIDEVFYRKNSLRTSRDTNIIITDCDSEDLRAFTYLNEKYCIGSLDGCDTWNQRRNCMVLWGKKYLRLRGIKDDYDFCSGFVAAAQYKNVILGQVGFTTDRGDMHYILDKERGRYRARTLKFVFELGGETENVTVTEIENGAVYEDAAAGVRITVRASDFVFDGKPACVRLNRETRNLEMIAFDAPREIVLTELAPSYGIFTMEVQTDTVRPIVTTDGECVRSQLVTDGHELSVTMPLGRMTYNEMMRAKTVITPKI